MIAQRRNNRNVIIFALSLIVILLFSLMIVNTPRLLERYRQETRIAEQTMLAESLEDRWKHNGYAPGADEIMVWLSWINAKDSNKRGLIFWVGFVDRESLGNPTARPKIDGGESRGTGSIKLATLQDHCLRTKRIIPERGGVSLYNPLLNIKVMIIEIEFLAEQYSSTALDDLYGPVKDKEDFPLAWACLAYNNGPGVANRLRRRGVRPRFTHYINILKRGTEINQGLLKRKGGEG